MSTPVRIVSFLIEHWNHILEVIILLAAAAGAALMVALKIALMWPGPQPDAWLQTQIDRLQRWKDWISQFSRKKSGAEKAE